MRLDKETVKGALGIAIIISSVMFVFWAVGNRAVQVDNRIVRISNWNGDMNSLHSGMTTEEIKSLPGVLVIYELTGDEKEFHFQHWANPELGEKSTAPVKIKELTPNELMGVFETRGFEPWVATVKALDL